MLATLKRRLHMRWGLTCLRTRARNFLRVFFAFLLSARHGQSLSMCLCAMTRWSRTGVERQSLLQAGLALGPLVLEPASNRMARSGGLVAGRRATDICAIPMRTSAFTLCGMVRSASSQCSITCGALAVTERQSPAKSCTNTSSPSDAPWRSLWSA